MKFTKEQAFESLKRELTNNDRKTLRMSTRSLDKLTDTLISEFADEEIGLPDFCNKAMAILGVFNDNIGKDRSDFIKQWEAEHPAPPDDDDESKSKKPEENPEMKALMERIAALEADKQASEKRASIAQKHKDIASRLKEKGVADDEWIDLQLSMVNLDRELDIDSEADKFVKLYNFNKAKTGAPVPPGKPSDPTVGQRYAKSLAEAKELAKKHRAALGTSND